MKTETSARQSELSPNRHAGTCRRPFLWCLASQQILLWLMIWLVVLAQATAQSLYGPYPMTTNTWPWNVNLTNAVCSNAPVTYVINGGTFDTTLMTAPASV